MPENDLKSLIEKNLALTEELRHEVKKITRYIWWGRVMGTLKFLLVIGAFAGAYFFVEPYLKGLLGSYQELLGGGGQGTGDLLKNVEELKRLLPKGAPPRP